LTPIRLGFDNLLEKQFQLNTQDLNREELNIIDCMSRIEKEQKLNKKVKLSKRITVRALSR